MAGSAKTPKTPQEYRKILHTLNPLFHLLLSAFVQSAANGKENRHVFEKTGWATGGNIA
jgi:hypothetical protein